MHIDAILCDAAAVRDGLLSVLGGGICRTYRPVFPSEFGFDLAVLATMTDQEIGHPHRFTIEFRSEAPESPPFAGLAGEFGTTATDGLGPGVSVPMVFATKAISIPAAGRYRVELSFGDARRTLWFVAVERA